MDKSPIGSGFANFLTTVPDQATAGEWRDIHTSQVRDLSGRYAGPWGIAWQGLDTVSDHIFEFGKSVEEATRTAMEAMAVEMVEWAKANAPWEDRTTDARQGLQAAVVTRGPRTVIYFGHSPNVPYGIWLEIMQNGRFAIVLPTLLHFAPQLGGRVAAAR